MNSAYLTKYRDSALLTLLAGNTYHTRNIGEQALFLFPYAITHVPDPVSSILVMVWASRIAGSWCAMLRSYGSLAVYLKILTIFINMQGSSFSVSLKWEAILASMKFVRISGSSSVSDVKFLW